MNRRARADRQDWVTPARVRDLVHAFWPGGFVDLASSSDNPMRAAGYWAPGLAVLPASEALPAWMNPPWEAAGVEGWLERFELHCDEHGVEGLVCLPAVPDRAWWRRFVEVCPTVVTTQGRLAYALPGSDEERGQPPCGTAIGWRASRRAPRPQRLATFLRLFGSLGNVATWWPRENVQEMAEVYARDER